MVNQPALEAWLEPEGSWFVPWDPISDADVGAYIQVLDEATNDSRTGEKTMQSYLEEHRILLVQHFGGGHGRWVVPKPRIGNGPLAPAYELDFIIGEKSSNGFRWVLVELEAPGKRLVTEKGDQAAPFTHAIGQVQDWRRWIKNNLGHVRRPPTEDGCGFLGIEPNAEGLIIIGREADQTWKSNALRDQILEQNRIKVKTYDFLVREAERRMQELGK